MRQLYWHRKGKVLIWHGAAPPTLLAGLVLIFGASLAAAGCGRQEAAGGQGAATEKPPADLEARRRHAEQQGPAIGAATAKGLSRQ